MFHVVATTADEGGHTSLRICLDITGSQNPLSIKRALLILIRNNIKMTVAFAIIGILMVVSFVDN